MAADTMMGSTNTLAQENLSDQILSAKQTAKQVHSAFYEAKFFTAECGEVGKQVDSLCKMIESLHCFTKSAKSIYERPIRRIVAETSRNLERALKLASRCKHQPVFRRLFNIIPISDFRKLFTLLDASIGDIRWLLSVLQDTTNGSAYGGMVLSLPPMAISDPIVSCVWSSIATVQMGKSINNRMEAANSLASLAQDSNRNRNIIVEEGGVRPLLRLLQEKFSAEAQIAAAQALCILASEQGRVRSIMGEKGVTVIVQVLRDSPMKVQIQAAKLVARMAEHDAEARDKLGREKVVSRLVGLLSFETLMDDPMTHLGNQRQSFMDKHSSVESKPKNHFAYTNMCLDWFRDVSSKAKERENEKPEVKLELKISCAKALWMLARGSVENSRSITETKGLRCLAKLVETGQGELQFICLMTIMETTAAAESDDGFRHAAFKTNSPAVKATVTQLLRVINELKSPDLQIPTIISIGSLARIFTASESRVIISSLVAQLSNKHRKVAEEAAFALKKFTCEENYLHEKHLDTIIELRGLPRLMSLLTGCRKQQLCELVSRRNSVKHTPCIEAWEQSPPRTVLVGAEPEKIIHHHSQKEAKPWNYPTTKSLPGVIYIFPQCGAPFSTWFLTHVQKCTFPTWFLTHVQKCTT